MDTCRLNYEEKMQEVEASPAQLQIPPEKQAEMIAYAKKLRAKFPHMKPDRIKRKVAEYFKVKLT